jgi:hypothetical protein
MCSDSFGKNCIIVLCKNQKWKFLLYFMIYNNSKKVPYVILFRAPYEATLGLRTEFRCKIIPRNRLGTVSIIPQKKSAHSEVHGRDRGSERN